MEPSLSVRVSWTNCKMLVDGGVNNHGGQKVTGENPKVDWAKFSALSLVVLML